MDYIGFRAYDGSNEVKLDELVDSITRRPEKKFKCEICLKEFSSKHCLKEHGYTHTNEKPYSCRVCQKQFKHASQLSLHKKAHLKASVLKWPKLTDLLAWQKERSEVRRDATEVIKLPLIERQQEFTLPKFNF